VSTHPNVLLICTLTPNGLSRKTMRDILAAAGIEDEEKDIKIDGVAYHHAVMESNYHDDWQVGADEGDLIFLDLVTYGYGEQIAWDALAAQKQSLENWAVATCAAHNCAYKISVSANYW
jgi:hypothetical protein